MKMIKKTEQFNLHIYEQYFETNKRIFREYFFFFFFFFSISYKFPFNYHNNACRYIVHDAIWVKKKFVKRVCMNIAKIKKKKEKKRNVTNKICLRVYFLQCMSWIIMFYMMQECRCGTYSWKGLFCLCFYKSRVNFYPKSTVRRTYCFFFWLYKNEERIYWEREIIERILSMSMFIEIFIFVQSNRL